MIDWTARSLAARLALVTAIWSACALLVTGGILTELFRRNAERTFDARIEADLVNLVRDASGTPGAEPALPEDALGSLFLEPFSGWAWQIRRGDQILAQSDSLGPEIAGVMEPLLAPEGAPGDFAAPGGIAARGASRPILLTGDDTVLTFAVAGPRSEIGGSLAAFSTQLLYSLAVFGAVMFVASLLLARMVLAPVGLLTEAVRRLRDGDASALNRELPRELVPVAAELRALSNHIDTLIERSRNQTSDLAHALKTPLSILRQGAARMWPGEAAEMLEQLEKIENSVDWHLTRRRLSGPRRDRVQVAGVAEGVIFAMQRLFAGRDLALNASIPGSLHFLGDEEDLHEILGNLAENACKWARSRVLIEGSAEGRMLRLSVEDDGPGIPAGLGEEIFRRGARLDEAAPGHGHGLAIVRDIVQSYGGEISAGRAGFGGAAIRMSLPCAVTVGA